jgi:hypothetical protein
MGGTGFGYYEKLEELRMKDVFLPQMFRDYEDLQLLSHRRRLVRASKSFNEIGNDK